MEGMATAGSKISGHTSAEFEEAYARLNAEQREAVDSIEGPVFVIAGPGTGKTQILTLRIANILQKTDTPPDGILALTFTEAAASEMRERLAKLIGTATSHRVRIHTYHGFANYLIARFPDAFPRIIGGEIATDLERAEMIDAAILNTKVEYLRPFGDPLYYHYEVTRAIATMKRENVTPEVLRKRIAESQLEYEAIPDKVHEKGKYEGKLKGEFETLAKKIAKTRDLLAVYEAYEAELEKRKRHDFEDVILEAVRALGENESFRREVQEGLLYVLADEHQDANRAQNALLELLVEYHDSPNLFIVGDEKQAIYRFQGADLDNVHYFRERFPGTKVIALVANYRSHQTILDTALSLIASSPDERLSRVPLVASGAAQAELAPIRRVECATPESEIQFLSNEIDALLKSGVGADDIAVLVRSNKDVAYVADGLSAKGISVSRGSEGSALENRFVCVLVRLLRAVAEPRDESLSTLFTLPGFHISAADAWRIVDLAKREKMHALDVLSMPKLLETAQVSEKGIEHAGKLRAFLDSLGRIASHERPAQVAQAALYGARSLSVDGAHGELSESDTTTTGIMDAVLMAIDREESLAAIRALLHSFEELSQREHAALLPRALELLALHEARNIPLTAASTDFPGLVRVMTVHKSKGREFAHVFIPRLTERAWSTRSRAEHFYLPDVLSNAHEFSGSGGEMEDERRLLYVAITRAKRAAVLSYPLVREDGKTEQASAFIDELTPELVVREQIVSTKDSDEKIAADVSSGLQSERARARAERLLASAHTLQPTEDDLATLRRAFLAQGLSPTALNNYIECPWHYFYVNLLRIPEAENKHMLYGTAIHTALKSYADRRVRGDEMNAEYIIGVFDRAISKSALSEHDLEELRAKGVKALTAWWKQNQPSWPAKAESELPVFATISLNEGGDKTAEFLFRGKLDRMDPLPGGTYSVVDYKTGKPKSRNALMGKTASSDGNYYRQLVAYKLLLAQGDPSREMTQGVIEFVEPDEYGQIRSEVFDISKDEVAELETQLKKIAHEIMTLSFWQTPCDVEDCKWCGIRFDV